MDTAESKPRCVGFIMDGNRRWARERNLPTLEGHRRGHEIFETIVRCLRDEGIEHGIFYAFSTENWNRSEEEVAYLMHLFKAALENILKGLEKDKVRLRIVGERKRFAPDIQKLMEELEEKSAPYTDTTIWLALSYGGRAEIIDAVNCAVERGKPVTEESFGQLLWTREMPDPDLIIRTSGEERLSNFLPWQSVYSELFFTKTYWPDFNEAEFKSILEEYGKRKRRKGT